MGEDLLLTNLRCRRRSEPTALEADLLSMGFRSVYNFTPELPHQRCFRDREDGLALPPSARVMKAVA